MWIANHHHTLVNYRLRHVPWAPEVAALYIIAGSEKRSDSYFRGEGGREGGKWSNGAIEKKRTRNPQRRFSEDIQPENNMMEISSHTNLSPYKRNSPPLTPALIKTLIGLHKKINRGSDGYVIDTGIPIAGDLL